MSDRIVHEVEKTTEVAASWPFPVKDSQWLITQESSHFPEIINPKSSGPGASCELKGGRPRCQFKLINQVKDDKGKPHSKEWWVDTVGAEPKSKPEPDVKLNVKSK